MCEKGYNPQKALDAEVRARIDALALLSAPMMGADITKLPRNADMRVRPGKTIFTRGRPSEIFEAHDSFFIGSDVFYTFLVNNGCWWDRQRQKDPDAFLTGLEKVRQKILTGTFPDYIVRRFEDMLEYFGLAPIIVRSSSLLEDRFG